MLKSSFGRGRYLEAGCDEAGRGCLAGPVVAAAVVFAPDYRNKELDDSKKLNLKQRSKLREAVERDAIAFAVAKVSNDEIDQINILNASFKAMHIAIERLPTQPELLLIDGNRFNPLKDYQFECIVKGDGEYLSIAGASILAKTYRDEIMLDLDREYPEYGWKTNVGYPTPEHRQAIKEFGITPYHRRSFHLYSTQLELFEMD